MKTKCLLMLLVVFSCAASFAGGPAPNNFILQIQNAGSPVVTTSSFIRLNCSTNVTCSLSGGTVNITASSTASTAWTAITAGTNAGQALLIGAGGSLGVTAGGTITASAAPWSGLTGFPSACTNQAVTGVGASLTCTTVTSAYVDSSIGKTANPLSQFASTTSAQLLATLSNPTGTGLAVFATSPSLTTPNIGAATASGLTLSGITGSTQCLQVNSSGVVAGSGAGCGGAGGSPGGSPGQIQWNSASAFGGVSGWTTNGTTTLTAGATSVLDLSAMAPTAGLKLPSVAGAAPTADGFIGVNVTNHTLVSGSNGTTLVQAAAATGTNTATTCSNQVVTAVSGIAAPTCTALTGSFLPNPSASTLGGVESLGSTPHQWINTISTSGVPSSTQPSLADIAAGVAPTGTFDFSGTTILKARVGATLTTSVNGDIGYDTTNKNWHVWQNAADSYLFSGLVSGTYTNGDCVKFNVASSVITLVDNGSACAGSAIINAANQYALSYYSAAGSASTVSGVAAPTVNGPYLCGYVISGSAASAPTCNFPGVAVDATNPATLLYTDRESYLQWTVGSTLTLPAAATNFATNFPFVIQNTSGSALALTPTTPNNIDGGSSQATSSVPNNYAAFVYQDATPNWQTIKFPTLAAFGTCVDTGGNHLNISSTGVFSCGTSSSGGSTAFSSLIGGTNSAAAMVIGTGASLTVSGSGTNNATSVNGNTFPASAGLTSGGLLYASSTSAVGSSALLATNSPVIGGGAGTAPKTVAGLLFDGTSKLTTGQSGTSAGNYCMANLTSGTICFAPVTGALGSAVITTPAATDTMALLAATQTFTNKSISLQQLTSATGAVGPWANGNNPLVINCALTSGTTCMTVGEATASTSVGSFGLRVTTLAGSDSTPLEVDNSLTGSQALATVSIIPTWNTSAGPSALVINPTNTASGAGALLIQAELSSVNKFTVDKSGNIVAAGSITVTSCSGCGSGLPSAAINTVAVGPTDVPGGSATTMTAVASPTPLYFVDPRAWIYIFDEFTNVPGTGISQWTVGGTGGTASWVANQTGTAYGVYACTTLAASSDACYATLNANSTGFNGSFNGFTKGDLIFRIKLTQTTNTNFFAGLIDINTQHGESSPSVVGIGYNVGKSDTGWMCVLGSASTYTRAATAGTLDTNWHDLRIRFTSAGHISCSVDQGAETAISTNFPTSTNMTPTISIDNNASANVAAYQGDYMLMAIGAAR